MSRLSISVPLGSSLRLRVPPSSETTEIEVFVTDVQNSRVGITCEAPRSVDIRRVPREDCRPPIPPALPVSDR